MGNIATIQHLGHHQYSLAPGKDTTVFYESGAVVSAGFDSEKSVLILRPLALSSVLDLFADLGYDYTLIEGFKSMGWPAIIMGELEADSILFRNPTIEQVMQEIDRFPEYHTAKSLERGIERNCGQKNNPVFAGTLTVPSGGLPNKDVTLHPVFKERDSCDSFYDVKLSYTAGIRTPP
jgi:molybdopterin-guanine dinucleotide biosynthesis protein MobB